MLTGRLKRLGMVTVRDLLFHFPFRYEDFSQIVPINQLQAGQECTVQGTIELIASRRSPRKRTLLTEAIVNDGTEQLRVIWFGQAYITKVLKTGDTVSLSGKIKDDGFGVQMTSPTYEKVSDESTQTHTARIVPMYPLTQGITQKQMRFLMSQVIGVAESIRDWLPEDIRDRADVMPLAEAIHKIHFPESNDEQIHAARRLKFDELFVLQLRAEMIRQSLRRAKAPELPFAEAKIKEFVSHLPFELTKDQKVSAWEMLQDMEKGSPMNRLLEGDVGSGKTVVAALIAYNTVLATHQVAFMAPTEILAKQHFASLCELLPEHNIVLLTSSELNTWNLELSEKTKKGRRVEMLEHLNSGSIDVIVGTHALLVDDIAFAKLGLVIVDEQHRFGVAQRKKIRDKAGEGMAPHFLSMTATPIPRSFALTLYGDLDVSLIKTMPAGRKPIKTRVVDPHNRAKAYQFIRAQVKQARQVFVICPLIDSSAIGVEKKSVMSEYKKLSEKVFPDLKIGYLHGKMRPKEKDEIMLSFANKELDVLVSTSVVEVGVNIPNASVMMIEDGEKFGLAQLHQFRGRVGRSDHQSYCFVFTETDSHSARERLGKFESTTDGFALAEFDLETRGPGEVYGTNQSGMQQFQLATMRDIELIKLARDMARDIDFENYLTLKEKVQQCEQSVHLE